MSTILSRHNNNNIKRHNHRPLSWWLRDDDLWSSFDTIDGIDDVFSLTKNIFNLRLPKTTTNKETGEVSQSIFYEIPGCSFKDVKASWNKETRTLTVKAETPADNENEEHRTYSYAISTFSPLLLEDTISIKVSNGILTISGLLKTKEREEIDIPVLGKE